MRLLEFLNRKVPEDILGPDEAPAAEKKPKGKRVRSEPSLPVKPKGKKIQKESK
jgi:hypothetical protein